MKLHCRWWRLLPAAALVVFATPAWGQILDPDPDGPIRGAIQGAAGAVRGTVGDAVEGVGDAVQGTVRGAVRGAFRGGADFNVDANPPRFGADIRTDADLDADFQRRFGRNWDRDQFRFSDGHWWYRTQDGRWIYDRGGRWYLRDGTPYRGFEARHLGSQHPRYRYHDNHWWYRTDDGWVFHRNGNWYRPNGRFFAPPRPDFTVGAGPVRLDLFVGNNGRRYRYYDDHWWYRDDGSWYFLRNGYWYDEGGSRQRRADPELRQRLLARRTRQADTARAEPGAEAQGSVRGRLASAPWPAPPANMNTDAGTNGSPHLNGDLPESLPPGAEAGPDAEASSDAGASAEAGTQREAGRETPTAPSAETEAEAGIEAEAEAKTEAEVEAKTEAEAGDDAGDDAGTETGGQANAAAETGTGRPASPGADQPEATADVAPGDQPEN